MATKAATFTGRKFGIAHYEPGPYTGVILGANKSNLKDKAGNPIWFVNISIDGMPSHQYNAKWVENDASVNALAMMVTNAMDSLGIAYQPEEIAVPFDQLMQLWTTKGIVGKHVKYEVVETLGTNGTAKLQKVVFA